MRIYADGHYPTTPETSTFTTREAETVDAMALLVRFDDTNRVGTTLDATPATEDRKELLRILIREAGTSGNRRHVNKIRNHFNALRTRRETIPALQVEAAIKYLDH